MISQSMNFFFQNPVYQTCSPFVQHIFTLYEDSLRIKFPKDLFPQRKTELRICTKDLGQRYYYCKDCSYDVDTSLCRQCFDLNLHADHNYLSHKEPGYCDCGFENRWNPQTFCKKHGKPENKVQIQSIDEEMFLNFYKECFQLYFLFLVHEKENQFTQYSLEFLKKLMNSLTNLNHQSIYYNELTTQLLKRSIMNQESSFSILKHLLKSSFQIIPQECKDLFWKMVNHYPFLSFYYQTLFLQIKSTEQLTQNLYLNKFHKDTSDCIDVLNELANKNITVFSSTSLKKEVLEYYFGILKAITSAKNRKVGLMVPVWKCLRRKEILKIQNIPEIYVGKIMKEVQVDEVLFRDMMPEFFKYLHQKIKKESEKGHKGEISFFLNQVIKLIYKSIEGREEKFIKYFLSLQIPEIIMYDVFVSYLREIVKNNTKMNILTVKSILIINYIMMKQKTFSVSIVDELWSHKNIQDFQRYRFSILIIKTLLAYQLKQMKNQAEFLSNPQDIQQNTKKRQKMFKEYLFMSKIVKKRCLIYLKKAGLLNFEEAPSILQSMTTYVRNNTQFVYSHEEIHLNHDLLLLDTSEIIPSIQFQESEKDTRFVTEERKFVIGQLFGKAFHYLLHSTQETQKKIKKLRYTEILGLVMMDKILLGKCSVFRQALIQIKNILKFHPLEDKKIFHLLKINIEEKLHIMNSENKEKKNSQINILCEKKNAGQSKRAKINEKFALKKLKMLEKMKVQEKIGQNQEGLECIICKEGYEKDNELYYLGKVKESGAFNVICLKKSTYNIVFNSCFHIVHENCYNKYKPNYALKGCPLCSDSSNCLLPIHLKKQNFEWLKKFNLQKREKHNNERIEVMKIILESLVFKNGVFNVFTSFNKKEEKVNNYLLNLILSIYEFLDFEQKNIFDSEVQLMKNKSEYNENSEIGLMEFIILQTIVKKIKSINIPINEKLLLDLSHKLSQIQFHKFHSRFLQLANQQDCLKSHENSKKQISIVGCPPLTMSEVRKLRKFCDKCPHIECWYCVLCQKTFCYRCDNISNHKKQCHNGYGLTLIINDGTLRISLNYNEKVFKVYENGFMEEWQGQGVAKQFNLNKEKYMETIGDWIRNY